MSFNTTVTLCNDGMSEIDYQVDFSFYGGYAAKTNALPEDCYEGEPAEIEFEQIMVEGRNVTNTLESGIYEKLEEYIFDNIDSIAIESGMSPKHSGRRRHSYDSDYVF